MAKQVCVIGAGTGGYVAALRLAQLGEQVTLIEKGDLGGVCLNKGCIPTKTLLKSAEKWQELQHADNFGLFVSEMAYDWEKIQERKNSVIYQLRSGIEKLLKAHRVRTVTGTAHLEDAHTVFVQTDDPSCEETIYADNIVLATGAEPARPPIEGAQLAGVITSDDLLRMGEVPASLVIIGAGAVGLEFAGIYATFGAQVTVVEMTPSILPGSDVDIQRRLALALKKQYITLKTGATVKKIAQGAEGLAVTIEVKGKAETVLGEKVLLATGRRPVYNAQELDKLGIAYNKRGIVVDERMETTAAGIYAIGDVTGLSMLAHSAEHQGLVAAVNIAGGEAYMGYSAIPSCVFTMPEVAQVGLTEQQCKEQGLDYVVSKFNFAANGKALSMGMTEGIAKLIATRTTHEILGCHIMGPHASDLIMEGVIALTQGLTAEELMSAIHPHPTLTETLQEAALGINGRMLHQLR